MTQSSDMKGETNTVLQEEALFLGQPEPEIVIVDAEEIPLEEAALPQSTPPLPAGKQHQMRTKRGCCGDGHGGFDMALCGDDKRMGTRVRPGCNVTVKMCGNSHIVLPKDPPAGAHYKFVMVNLCGDARVFVPKETKVILRRISLCGNRTIDVEDEVNVDSSADHTRVTVTIVQLCGDVRIMNHEEDFQEE